MHVASCPMQRLQHCLPGDICSCPRAHELDGGLRDTDSSTNARQARAHRASLSGYTKGDNISAPRFWHCTTSIPGVMKMLASSMQGDGSMPRKPWAGRIIVQAAPARVCVKPAKHTMTTLQGPLAVKHLLPKRCALQVILCTMGLHGRGCSPASQM
jgi:hypothetical protein